MKHLFIWQNATYWETIKLRETSGPRTAVQ